MVCHNDTHAAPSYDPVMAVPNWSPVLADDRSRPAAQAEPLARHLDRENAALRELVTVYRHLSGLALQDADLAGVVRLISDRTAATVAVLTQLMDVLTAAAPGVTRRRPPRVREHMVHGWRGCAEGISVRRTEVGGSRATWRGWRRRWAGTT